MKGTESFKQTIHSYLEQRASEDTLFAEKYHAVNRSIDDIVTPRSRGKGLGSGQAGGV